MSQRIEGSALFWRHKKTYTKFVKLRIMSQKKTFLVLVTISTITLLFHYRSHLSRTQKAYHPTCPSLGSQRPKHTSIAFLKTHKTASSTVQNILFRFAERHNLTVALPVQTCGHQFCYPRPFSARFVHPHTVPPSVITSHMRFDTTELRRLMPNDTLYITILREPAAMFESLFSYYNQYCLSFKHVPNGSLEAFLSDPWTYYRPGEKSSMYAHNSLTYDLGGDKDLPARDVKYAQNFVDQVERVFSLVMIAEHFDESLVLLRRLLSWDLEDVLYLKLNMRTPDSKRHISPDLPAKIRSWNALDARLYDHFNASLWRQLGALGLECVAREVQLLRKACDRLVRGCFGGRLPQLRIATQIKNKDFRPWQPSANVDIVGYDMPVNLSLSSGITRDRCLKLIIPEVKYFQLLLSSHSLRYRGKNLTPGSKHLKPRRQQRVRGH